MRAASPVATTTERPISQTGIIKYTTNLTKLSLLFVLPPPPIGAQKKLGNKFKLNLYGVCLHLSLIF